ncbi:nucleotidyltransferase domain-containing protein [Litorilinea aerophila]|uniref:Nucleotidyltransferase domain-containing protein n=1 Tax=Litorilinea aerophila TaxID=1204385 RepID=A0A540V967_9CHLR|nr:nucleotidyltransferase domain-containing protein [Litorilinea aerophila]MCC9078789.1 nucleotidyltransferase domain-containing protein [Litorilinea aerophila]
MDTDAHLAEQRTAYVASLEEALQQILGQLRQMPQVERVILFGSYAAGHRNLFTDLDLLVVMDSRQDFLTRSAQLRQRLKVDVDLDLAERWLAQATITSPLAIPTAFLAASQPKCSPRKRRQAPWPWPGRRSPGSERCSPGSQNNLEVEPCGP